jgi:hypothetical protein
MASLTERIQSASFVGLILSRATSGEWMGAVEVTDGKWIDGPICADRIEAILAVLDLAPAPALLPPPPY